MKTLPIEDLLAWAYREELPKAGAIQRSGPARHDRAWRPVEDFGELLAEVDCSLPMNRFGLAIDMGAETAPHPDAVALHEAAMALDDLVLEWPEGWNPLEDIDDGDPLYAAAVGRGMDQITRIDRDGARILVVRPSDLVRRQAILGGAPDTYSDKPSRRTVTEHGKPKWFMRVLRPQPTIDGGEIMVEVEVDGRDYRRHRPYPSAYQKHYLDPDPMPVVIARAEYEVWRSAMDLLAEHARALGLATTGCRWPARPWMDGEPTAVRILPVVGAMIDSLGLPSGQKRKRGGA